MVTIATVTSRGVRSTRRTRRTRRSAGASPEPKRAPRNQREVLRDVMLSAGSCGTWLTLRELSRITRYGEASISAQLRHLRKRNHGGFVIEKRRRLALGGRMPSEPMWEYRLGGSRAVESNLSWLTPAMLRGAIHAARMLEKRENTGR